MLKSIDWYKVNKEIFLKFGGKIMIYIKFDYFKVFCFFEECEFDYFELVVKVVYDLLYNGMGVGNDVFGWINLLIDYDKEEFVCIKKVIEKIYSDFDVLIVIGIGGFYFGVCVVIEILNYFFYNVFEKGVCKIF